MSIDPIRTDTAIYVTRTHARTHAPKAAAAAGKAAPDSPALKLLGASLPEVSTEQGVLYSASSLTESLSTADLELLVKHCGKSGLKTQPSCDLCPNVLERTTGGRFVLWRDGGGDGKQLEQCPLSISSALVASYAYARSIIDAIITAGKEMIHVKGFDGNTPLHVAAGSGHAMVGDVINSHSPPAYLLPNVAVVPKEENLPRCTACLALSPPSSLPIPHQAVPFLIHLLTSEFVVGPVCTQRLSRYW